MEYLEFVRIIEKEINHSLKGGMKAKLHTTIKNNSQKKIGIIVERPDVNISPTIYLEDYFIAYHHGIEIKEISKQILNFYEAIKCDQSWNTDALDSYSAIRKKIVFKVVNTEKNQAFLNCVPHIDFLDLSLVFYVLLEANKEGTATMVIQNDNMENWGICLQELLLTAIENVNDLLPPQLFTMKEVIEELKDSVQKKNMNILEKGLEDHNEVMYILSNPFRNLGAACMAYPGVLKMIGEILETDYYLLPSSVHEVIIVPKRQDLNIQEMTAMVKEVNSKLVEPEEILSDHAYYYSCVRGKLLMSECGR